MVLQKLSGVPATHSLAYVDEESVMTTDLDDAASELGSHNIGGRACDGQVFSSVMTFGRRVRGTITLSGKKPAPREQREGLKNVEWLDYRSASPVPPGKTVNGNFVPGVRGSEQWTKRGSECGYLSNALRCRWRHNGRDENAQYAQ